MCWCILCGFSPGTHYSKGKLLLGRHLDDILPVGLFDDTRKISHYLESESPFSRYCMIVLAIHVKCPECIFTRFITLFTEPCLGQTREALLMAIVVLVSVCYQSVQVTRMCCARVKLLWCKKLAHITHQ